VAKQFAPQFVALVVAIVAVSGVVFLLGPPPWFAFVLGAGDATLASIMVARIVRDSGTASTVAGAVAELWTRDEVKPLHRAGWRVLHGVPGRPREDIDHVVVGPAGVYVIETKWSSMTWSLADRSMRQRIDRATEQAEAGARRIAGVLKEHELAPRVHPLVVLWGPHGLPDNHSICHVPVVHGSRLREWLEMRSAGSIESIEVDRCVDVIGAYADMRHGYEDENRTDGPFVVMGPSRVAADVGAGAGAGIASLLAVAWCVATVPLPYSLALAGGVPVLGVVARRIRRLALPALGWAVGGGIAFSGFTIAFAVLALKNALG
jgi:hypothetical protein